MRTVAYYPQKRILTVLDENGYIEVSYSGGIAERKFVEAIHAGENVSLANGNFKMKLKPANISAFLGCGLDQPFQRIILKRKEKI